MIIADENLEQYWIELLEAQGYVVYSIRKNQPGLTCIDSLQCDKIIIWSLNQTNP